MQIGDVEVDRVGFKDVESALVTLNKDLLISHLSSKAFETPQKEIWSLCAQESHQITLYLLFHYDWMYDDIHILYVLIVYLHKCLKKIQSQISVIHVIV